MIGQYWKRQNQYEKKIHTMIAFNPLAPVLFSLAVRATILKASSVNCKSIFTRTKREMYLFNEHINRSTGYKHCSKSD